MTFIKLKYLVIAVAAIPIIISFFISKEKPWIKYTILSLGILSIVVQLFLARHDISEYAKSKFTGRLSSKKSLIFSTKKNIFPKFRFGSKGTILEWKGSYRAAIFKFFDDSQFVIAYEKGKLKVSTKIRDINGKIIAEIVDNEWKVAPSPLTWDRNYSDNALEVKNAEGDVVLQIKLVNDTAQFQGVIYDSAGEGIFMGQAYKDGEWHGILQRLGPTHPKPDHSIEPIFKYPSDLHLGEYVG